jgi:hypothetical protein
LRHLPSEWGGARDAVFRRRSGVDEVLQLLLVLVPVVVGFIPKHPALGDKLLERGAGVACGPETK